MVVYLIENQKFISDSDIIYGNGSLTGNKIAPVILSTPLKLSLLHPSLLL